MSIDPAPYALVVEDDFFILMDAVAILNDAGFRVLEAHDVTEALEVLSAHGDEVCLLFTDVEMPGDRNGFDLARETVQLWPDVKILVASGRARPGDGDLPPNATFIEKPFTAQVVRERLQELLLDGQKPEPLKRRD